MNTLPCRWGGGGEGVRERERERGLPTSGTMRAGHTLLVLLLACSLVAPSGARRKIKKVESLLRPETSATPNTVGQY